MDHANFDELLAKLIEKCKLGESNRHESSTSSASQLLEIESTIRNIDKELDHYNIRINESLERYKTKITNLSEVKKEQTRINFEETDWTEFEATLNSRMTKFLQVRQSFLDLIEKEEISNEKYQENSLDIEKRKMQNIHENLSISDEISKVDENIEILNFQIHEARNRIDFLKIENAVLRDCLEKEAKKWRQCVDETEEKICNPSQKRTFH